jgi:hypothetical protein
VTVPGFAPFNFAGTPSSDYQHGEWRRKRLGLQQCDLEHYARLTSFDIVKGTCGPRPTAVCREKLHEAFWVALEAQGRYKLRTSLSVLGVVLGVAAVIAMMSVTEGARRDALEQVQLLASTTSSPGIASSRSPNRAGVSSPGLTVSDALLLPELVPWSAQRVAARRTDRAGVAGRTHLVVPLVGIRPSYQTILKLRAGRGRLPVVHGRTERHVRGRPRRAASRASCSDTPIRSINWCVSRSSTTVSWASLPIRAAARRRSARWRGAI